VIVRVVLLYGGEGAPRNSWAKVACETLATALASLA
jgi:hypothetical protein